MASTSKPVSPTAMNIAARSFWAFRLWSGLRASSSKAGNGGCLRTVPFLPKIADRQILIKSTLMDTSNIPPEIQREWAQPDIPIIVRSGIKGDKLTARLPYRPDNRQWLNGLATGNRRPTIRWAHFEKSWKLPLNWLNRFVDGALVRYGRVYVVQPYREMEKCAPACRNAVGHDCQCSCMGANHGTGDGDGWFDVSDTFSFRWGPQEAAIRLMTRRS